MYNLSPQPVMTHACLVTYCAVVALTHSLRKLYTNGEKRLQTHLFRTLACPTTNLSELYDSLRYLRVIALPDRWTMTKKEWQQQEPASTTLSGFGRGRAGARRSKLLSDTHRCFCLQERRLIR